MEGARLGFKTLFAIAINEWPETVDLSHLQRYDSNEDRYSPGKLGELTDRIIEHHIGTESEVITRGIHDAIMIVLHKLALNCISVKLSTLRVEAVQAKFEERLKSSLSRGGDLNWTAKDHELAKRYFLQNSP